MLELTAGVGAEKDVGDLGRLDEGLAVRALGDGVAVEAGAVAATLEQRPRARELTNIMTS